MNFASNVYECVCKNSKAQGSLQSIRLLRIEALKKQRERKRRQERNKYPFFVGIVRSSMNRILAFFPFWCTLFTWRQERGINNKGFDWQRILFWVKNVQSVNDIWFNDPMSSIYLCFNFETSQWITLSKFVLWQKYAHSFNMQILQSKIEQTFWKWTQLDISDVTSWLIAV